MRERITHRVGEFESKAWMPLCEPIVNGSDFICGLAYDLEIANDRILNKRTFNESRAIKSFDIGFDARDGDDDMLDIVENP